VRTWGKRNPHTLLVGRFLVQPLCKTVYKLLKNVKIDMIYVSYVSYVSYDTAIPLLGIYLKECESGYNKGTWKSMFISALFTIAKLWKQTRCPTTDDWIKKTWCLYTMEFYSAIKKNEILSFAGKWMELENIIFNEVN
jgi:hypothetical protein